MFLRAKNRFKDGKLHRYWSIVENFRTIDDNIVQRHVLYLGEINDSQHAAWCKTIDVLLYDLTSTYFECDPPGAGLRRFGYSRDKRSDCVQGFCGADPARRGPAHNDYPLQSRPLPL